jgi:hypothetical protein
MKDSNVKRKIHDNTNPKDKAQKLIDYSEENKMIYSVMLDYEGCIAAVSYYDPILAPTPHEACAVNTSASGISKWSFFS